MKPVRLGAAVVVGVVVWFVVPVPSGVDPNAWHLLAIFVATIFAIIAKAMPIGALSILAIAVVAATRVTDQDPGESISNALSSFANPLIWLIGIAILLSRGIVKTGLGQRIGYLFVSLFGKRAIGLGYALALGELTLAPVTPSNTARGGAIMHPIMRSVADTLDSKPEDGTEGKIGTYLALVNYHANPITSAMFVTATAPNPLIVSLVADATGSDVNLTWGTWALAMVAPGLAALLLMPLVIRVLSPPEESHTQDASASARDSLSNMGPLARGEKTVLAVLAVLAVLLLFWAEVPKRIWSPLELDPTTTAFIGLALLLVTKVLTWRDVTGERTAWDTIVWFSALVMMASYLNELGLTTWFADEIESAVSSWGISAVLGTAFLVLVFLYVHYFFASTTAHISAMFGAFYGAGLALGANATLLALLMAAASSIMMTLTHYATGTSPIIFGSGYVGLERWWAIGFVMSVVNSVVWLVVGLAWWHLIGIT